jgi:hypothetical protein
MDNFLGSKFWGDHKVSVTLQSSTDGKDGTRVQLAKRRLLGVRKSDFIDECIGRFKSF